MDSVLDTGYRVSTVWSDPRGTSNRFTVADPVFMNGKYSSVLEINYLQSSDSGTYTCSASVSPDPASAFIRESEVVSERESIDVGELVGIFSNRSGQLSQAALVWCVCVPSSGIPLSADLNVTITIQYSPPAGVTLRPPNYRPATSVSLRCDAAGTTGSVTYRWSSTCGSGCFVSGSSQTVSRSYLYSYDAGDHKCVVTDGAGNTGTATTEMNIVG